MNDTLGNIWKTTDEKGTVAYIEVDTRGWLWTYATADNKLSHFGWAKSYRAAVLILKKYLVGNPRFKMIVNRSKE